MYDQKLEECNNVTLLSMGKTSWHLAKYVVIAKLLYLKTW